MRGFLFSDAALSGALPFLFLSFRLSFFRSPSCFLLCPLLPPSCAAVLAQVNLGTHRFAGYKEKLERFEKGMAALFHKHKIELQKPPYGLTT